MAYFRCMGTGTPNVSDSVFINYDDYIALQNKNPNYIYITSYGDYYESVQQFKGPYYIGDDVMYDAGLSNYDLIITKSIVDSTYAGFDTDIELHSAANIERDWEIVINWGDIASGKKIVIGNKLHESPYFWIWTESGKLRMTLNGDTVLNIEDGPSANIDYIFRKVNNVISVYKGSTLLNSYNWDPTYIGSNPTRIGNSYDHGQFTGTLNYCGFKWLS